MTIASTPFDVVEDADVILRSSDNVEFFVLKAFLSFASSFFKHMFSDGNPDEIKNGLPVAPVVETAKIIRKLLLFCYPGEPPLFEDVQEVTELHEAVSKYCMDSVEKRIQKSLLKSPLILQEPVRLFAISVHYGWREVCEAAAKNTLFHPASDHPSIKELRLITGLDYRRLLDYHKRCSAAAETTVQRTSSSRRNMYWRGIPEPSSSWWCAGSPCCSDARSSGCWVSVAPWKEYHVHLWLMRYFEDVAERLKERPRGKTVMDDDIVNRLLNNINCAPCKATMVTEMRILTDRLSFEVEKVISQVPLELDLPSSSNM
ncbi:uncharacterized protein EV420DRAFT_1540683 [Desarmillaria tabescens]|uniref:BTB domain-containing protein n=1 Tax=Armillaria tabescens TaxID=1929756 RepID=A0AA39KCT9_ARMTA|nr:uncharacterized protein EV420DRAFT_1540683 [Desarmillaria tabescens]KAK0458812.1 hypothetical protein EV420DRAFT_1540683 [Desarmillaria tabescens]